MFIRVFFFHDKPGQKATAILVIQSEAERRTVDLGEQLFSVIHANTGLQLRQEPISEIKDKYKKATPDEVQPIWYSLYETTKYDCLHQYR
jgi:hypothetical protein